MKEFKYVVTDPEGIHARPAGELVKLAKSFESSVMIEKEGKKADPDQNDQNLQKSFPKFFFVHFSSLIPITLPV